jgi:ATP-dependent helicase YprA (DUF1998 family)
MHSSVMITQELLQQVGLPSVLEACHCRTPQGRRIKKAVRFYDDQSRVDLEQELAAIFGLTNLIKEKHPQVVEVSTQLSRLRELRGTFNRLEKGGLLDDTEFFELKGALTIFSRLSRLSEVLDAASVSFEDTTDAIRKTTTILITNPDMLHQGILPHHTNWASFFAKLRFVVIDEMHIYRGVFGSHFANLIRRLKRICAFYNAYPQFILTSATIGNPEELATNLVEQKVHLINNDGSPKGPSHFLVYNPPLVDEKLGIRKSSIDFGVTFTQKLMKSNHQSLIFARTRRTVEMLLAYLRNRLPFQEREWVRGYRSGYLK